MSLIYSSRTPSWKQGFAHSASEAANPGLWEDLRWYGSTVLGPTGMTLVDLSGYGVDGVLTNMPESAWQIKDGRHMLFIDETDDDFVNIADSDQFDFASGDFSVCATIHPLSFGGNDQGRILDKGGATAASGWTMRVNTDDSGRVEFIIDDGHETVTGTGSISANNTYHCIFTFDEAGGDGRFWLNGLRNGNSVGGGSAPTDNSLAVRVGRRHDDLRGFDGWIGDCGFWGRHLRDDEIRKLYADPYALFRQRLHVPAGVQVAAGGDPEASLIGGKLISGGLLTGSRLVG